MTEKLVANLSFAVEKLRILILEDDPSRMAMFKDMLKQHEVVECATAAEAISALGNRPCFHVAFLDHDLGGEAMVASGPGTGYEVACWIEEHLERSPSVIVIHSFNPSGSREMAAALRHCAVDCLPGAWMMDFHSLLCRLFKIAVENGAVIGDAREFA